MSEGGDNVSMMELYKAASGDRKISKSWKVERGGQDEWEVVKRGGEADGGGGGQTGSRVKKEEGVLGIPSKAELWWNMMIS